MHAVVSLLDGRHYRVVEGLWAELDRAFGLRGVAVTPFPHFSYQVAAGYDPDTLRPILQRRARDQPPFRVRTGGLGLFTGASPVLYVPVVRDEALTRFHGALWSSLAGAGAGVLPYYRPEHWLPHITLAHGDLTGDDLPAIVRALGGRDFGWAIAGETLELIYDTRAGQEVRLRFALGTGEEVSESA
jgi:hypothetical protein